MLFLLQHCKIKGYTLLYAILIMIIVCSFSLFFLTYFKIADTQIVKAQTLTIGGDYGFNTLSVLAGPTVSYNQEYLFTYPDGYRSISMKKRWGGYELFFVTIILTNSDTVFNKIALVGTRNDSEDRTALYLRNTSHLLYLSDSVSITGDCYIPRGIFKVYHSPMVPKLTQTHQSGDSLPQLRNIDSIVYSLKNISFPNKVFLLNYGKKVSFSTSTEIIAADTIQVDNSVTGKVILTARVIIIRKGVTLNGVILKCRSVFFPPEFRGALQCYATDTISIQNNSVFNFPSLLALIPQKPFANNRNKNAILTIRDSVLISGDVIGYSPDEGSKSKPHIQFGKGGEVLGGVYCNGYLQIHGRIYGRVFCDKLIESSTSSVQENLLAYIKLNVDSLPPFFTFSNLFPSAKGEKKVVQWVQ